MTGPRPAGRRITSGALLAAAIVAAAGPAVDSGASAAGAQDRTGEPVSMTFQAADLRAVLRTFADISGLNIVLDPEVRGTVDVALTDIPWDQAFDVILRANRLGYEVHGAVVRVAPQAVLAEEAAQRRREAEDRALEGELAVMTRPLGYARAADLADLVTAAALSVRGQVQIDVRTNTLIVSDVPARLEAARDLIDRLDHPEPQVEIEARIVQANQDYVRQLGVQWALAGRTAAGIDLRRRAGIGGRLGLPSDPEADDEDASDDGADAPLGRAVDLGASAATTALGLTLGAIDGSLHLDLVLSAAESAGQVKILSTPRITTQNNAQATIVQGDQIPIQTVANNTVTVTFRDAALRLAVTPRITTADTVIMEIEIGNDFADFGRAVNGVPSIVTQSAATTVQVADGATTVIGGIYEHTRSEARRRVPGLHRIPLFGRLFRSRTDRRRSEELLIFLTPHVVR